MFLFFLSHFEQNTLFDLTANSEAKNIDNKTLIKIYEKFGFKIANNVINTIYNFKDSKTVLYKKQVQR